VYIFGPKKSVWLCGDVGGEKKGQANFSFLYFPGVFLNLFGFP
jgi:hypothetical protein